MTISEFFFNDTATTEIYTLSLHDALPISRQRHRRQVPAGRQDDAVVRHGALHHGDTGERDHVHFHVRPSLRRWQDRKSTRLNSSHANISYAVFCLQNKYRMITLLTSSHAN